MKTVETHQPALESPPSVAEEVGSVAVPVDRTSSVGWRRSSKIRAEHLQKLAIVYVRQSSVQQVGSA